LRQDGGSAGGFWTRNDAKKRGGVRGLTRRGVCDYYLGTQIPASIKALIKVARALRGLIAARYAAKSEGA
jgi:hypothetical protein